MERRRTKETGWRERKCAPFSNALVRPARAVRDDERRCCETAWCASAENARRRPIPDERPFPSVVDVVGPLTTPLLLSFPPENALRGTDAAATGQGCIPEEQYHAIANATFAPTAKYCSAQYFYYLAGTRLPPIYRLQQCTALVRSVSSWKREFQTLYTLCPFFSGSAEYARKEWAAAKIAQSFPSLSAPPKRCKIALNGTAVS
ncbi:hypothetical protein MRX96_033432 [Rhipicephalus microplus]